MTAINSRISSSEDEPATLKTILFVEDEDFLRTVVADVLTGAGYHVLAASNGVEATEVRAQYHGPLHLLLTDFCMPLKNGEILAEELRAAEPDLRTIFISGYGDMAEGAAPSDRISFLPKPFSIRALISKIRETLDTADAKNIGAATFNEKIEPVHTLAAVAS